MALKTGKSRTGRTMLVAALLATTSLGLAVMAAPQAALAQTQRQVSFAIPAGPLSAALAAFGRQAGLQVTYLPEIATGKRSPGMSGSAAPGQALGAILQGSGLGYRFSGANTVTIVRPSSGAAAGLPEGAIPLDTIDVQGSEAGTIGYVATRSSAGTKTDTPLIETPQSISVVTRQQMDAQNTQSVAEALRYTAGVMPEYRGSMSRYDFPYIRGYGGLSPTQYLDGMRLLIGSFAMPQISQNELERIEVLRGPASVLYGQNVPGGLANLVSKRPTSTPQHSVEFQVGSREAGQVSFDTSGLIDPNGQFLYRVTGLAQTANGQVDFTQQRRFNIAPSFTWRPSEDTSLTVLSSYQYDPEGGFFGFLPASGTVLPNRFGKIPRSFFDGDPSHDRFKRTQASIGYILEHRFNDVWSLNHRVRYQRINSTYEHVFGQGLRPDGRTLSRSVMDSYESLDAFTADTNAKAVFDTGPLRHTFLAGFDYSRGRLDQVRYFGAGPTLDIVTPRYFQAIAKPPLFQDILQDQQQLGVYAQEQVKVGGLTLLFGAREDWARTNTDNHLNRTSTRQFDRAFTWRTGAVYEFANGIAPYVSYTESFQPTAGTDRFGVAFSPTTAQQYEAGIKFQPAGWNSFMTVAAFDLTQQNVVTADPAGGTFRVQTGEVRTRGFEAEVKASLSEGLDLVASYTYLDPENTKANGGLQGKSPVLIPRDMASLWANYTFKDGLLRGLGLGGGVRYVGETWGDAENTFKVPAYTVVDAAIRYDFGAASTALKGWSGSVNATNLLDKTYVSGCTYAGGCYYAQGRTVLAKLKYEW